MIRFRRQQILVFGILAILAGAGPATAADPVGRTPSNHQDSVILGRVTSAVIPADGLLSVGLGGRIYSTVYNLDEFLERVSQKDLCLWLETVPWPWLQVAAELPYRTWSDGKDWIPASGSGLGDGTWQVTAGRSIRGRTLFMALYGGGNIPVGSKTEGLTEGVFSPHVGGALSWCFWPDRQVPEMRLHLNFGYRWNRSEETGYGMGRELFEPWFPRYQSAAEAGGDSRNDQTGLGAALEFRKGTTSIWIEYVQDRFHDNATIAAKEQFSAVGAGMRWGVMEGWAVRAEYLVSLATDKLESDWDPAYPELVMEFGVSRQFPVGGHDTDGDGVIEVDAGEGVLLAQTTNSAGIADVAVSDHDEVFASQFSGNILELDESSGGFTAFATTMLAGGELATLAMQPVGPAGVDLTVEAGDNSDVPGHMQQKLQVGQVEKRYGGMLELEGQ